MSNLSKKSAAPVASNDELMQFIAKLQEENKALKAAAAQKRFTMKVGEKGNLCIYGLQRFPFSFYRQQIEQILDRADEIRAFIKANADNLASKG